MKRVVLALAVLAAVGWATTPAFAQDYRFYYGPVYENQVRINVGAYAPAPYYGGAVVAPVAPGQVHDVVGDSQRGIPRLLHVKRQAPSVHPGHAAVGGAHVVEFPPCGVAGPGHVDEGILRADARVARHVVVVREPGLRTPGCAVVCRTQVVHFGVVAVAAVLPYKLNVRTRGRDGWVGLDAGGSSKLGVCGPGRAQVGRALVVYLVSAGAVVVPGKMERCRLRGRQTVDVVERRMRSAVARRETDRRVPRAESGRSQNAECTGQNAEPNRVLPVDGAT